MGYLPSALMVMVLIFILNQNVFTKFNWF